MKLLFKENSLNLRGTSVAIYDYAFYLKQIYGYECVITYDINDTNTNAAVVSKFRQNFELIPYKTVSDLDGIITNNQIDVMYVIKSGSNDGVFTDKAKTCVHAVFPTDPVEKHGDVYAYVSRWLSNYCSNGTVPYVPHMINLPECNEHYRLQLNIPNHSVVFGRYGGYESFDIPFVYQAIHQILEETNNTYFLFCNTHCFINHPRVIFTNSTPSLSEKVKFINTCDAMLHARSRGETFGLSILEFMSKNKPVFTFGRSEEKHHYDLLGGQGFIYNNQEELVNLVVTFDTKPIHYEQVQDFLPDSIIRQFHTTFLD